MLSSKAKSVSSRKYAGSSPSSSAVNVRPSREITKRPSPVARSMRRAPSPNGLSVALPRKRFSSGFMVTEPHDATSPSSRVNTSLWTWIITSLGPMANPPPCSAGMARRLEEVNCAMVLCASPCGAGVVASAAASAGVAAGGCDGSGVLMTIGPIGVASALGATGGPVADEGPVASQRVGAGGASGRPAGLAISSVSRFFLPADFFSSVAGENGCGLASASLAACATSRMGACCSAWSIRSAIASLPALRNHSRARDSSPFWASARPR